MFLGRLGDWVNPIVVKEARQAVNSRLVASGLLLFLIIQVVAMFLILSGRDPTDSDDMRIGRQVFTFVQAILLGACMLLIPAMTGMRLASERSDVKVDLLFISSLTPRKVLSGKLAAACAVALLIFSACTPFMAFAYILRGLDLPTILLVLTTDFLAVIVGTMSALFLASIPASRGFRILLALGGIIYLIYLTVGTGALTSSFLTFGVGDTETWQFWASAAGLLLLTLASVAMVFVWSVALISPPMANRALPVRAYSLAFWVGTLIACIILKRFVTHEGPVVVWGMLGIGLACLHMVIAVCERDNWGYRVARRIPSRALLRVPAFLFYSGACGGLLFGLMLGGLTLGVMRFWYGMETTTTMTYGRIRDDYWDTIVIATLLLGYAYCYSLTAALFRNVLRNYGFSTALTWIAGAAIFGVLCTVPLILQFTLFSRQYQNGFPDEVVWMHLANPIVMIPLSLERTDSRMGLTVVFLVFWAVVVTLLNGRWLVQQMTDFRPPESALKPLDV